MTPTPITYIAQDYNQRKKAAAALKVETIKAMHTQGKTLSEIAQAVGLSEITVYNHLQRVKREARYATN